MAFAGAHIPTFVCMLVLLCMSAFFSGSETAVFSLTRLDLRRYRRQKGALARAVTALAGEPGEFLSTVLFCNMLVNISFFSLASGLTAEIGKLWNPFVAAACSVAGLILVITFGEITPKSLAVFAPRLFLTVTAGPMYAIHRLFRPVRSVLRRAVRLAERITARHDEGHERRIEELRLLLQVYAEEGELTSNEQAMMTELLDLSAVKLRECMTPRVDIVMVRDEDSVQDALRVAREPGQKTIPVQGETRDEIVGVVDALDLFLWERSGSVAEHMTPPVFVSEYQRADTAIKLFTEGGARLGAVVDEYGGVSGVVTLSDIVAEIVGDIPDDDAPEMPRVRRAGDGGFLLAGSLSIRDFREMLESDQQLPPVDTVGGLVACLLGRVPRVGERVRLGPVELEVTRVSRRRVEEAALRVIDDGGDD